MNNQVLKRSYINQYKLFFVVLWVMSYFIYPAWALPVSDLVRYCIFSGLLVFFLAALFFLDKLGKPLNFDKPFFEKPDSWFSLIKNNYLLSIICLFTAGLHVYPIVTRPILMWGDEALHINGGLWIYNYIDNSMHKYIQIASWVLVGTAVLLKRRHFFVKNPEDNKFNLLFSNYSIAFIFCLAVVYFLFLHDLSFYPSIIRYPPLSRYMYLVLYSLFGIDYIAPRFLQLAFYILSAIYLYRTIILYYEKRTALLAASIFLFLPVTFIYASLAEVGCGTLFFMFLISYHFLRFVKNEDSRDIVLTSFFIGAGFLYKRPIFLLLFICAAFLVFKKLNNKKLNIAMPLKFLSLSLVPIIPWMVIGKLFTWRNYKVVWSNLIPPQGKVFAYFLHLPTDISWLLFSLFICSVIYFLINKKNDLSMFFLLLLVTYYFFYAMDMANISPRLSMAFYPTITVFTAVFVSFIADKIRWRHSFTCISIILISFMISICVVPSLKARYLQSVEFRKLQDYPNKKAMRWVKHNVASGEKILTLRIMPALIYRDKFEINKNRIVNMWFELNDVSDPEKLRQFIHKNKITYVMFPYGPQYHLGPKRQILKYLKENRNNEYIEVAKFNISENYIYIYSPK